MENERPTEMSRRSAFCFVVGCVLYFLIYWHRLLLRSQIPFDGNMLRLFYPSWVIGKKLLVGGQLLWDPYRNMGQPFLADPQNQALYPIRFLSVLLNFLDYERIFVVGHGLLAAVPAYLLGKRLFGDEASALLAALALGFSGFFLARVTVPTHFATMAWLPALMLLLDARRPVLLGFGLALQWMAGFPPFFILTFVVLFIFSFVSDPLGSSLACLAKGYALMLGLAAVQWIPFLEMLKESARPVFLSGADAVEYSVHPLEILRQTVVPSFVLTSLKPVTDSDPAMTSFYIGPIFLFLVVLGARRGGRRERIFLGMALFGLIMALGRYNKFYQYIPLITVFRFPAHWILLSVVGLALVGAKGLGSVKNRHLRWSLFGLVALDLLVYALPLHAAWGDPDFFSQAPLRLEKLRDIPKESRVLHSSLITDRVHLWKIQSKDDWLLIKGILVPSIGAAYGIKEAASYNVLTSKRHLAFLYRLNHSPASSPLLDYAGISRIVFLTKERDAKPIPEWKDCGVIENRGFRPEVFMESDHLVLIEKADPGRVLVQAEGPGRLILSEAYHPGWRATIDGHKGQVGILENEFPTVDLTPGTHQVLFFYRPRSFVCGLAVSGLSVLGIFVWRALLSKIKTRTPFANSGFSFG